MLMQTILSELRILLTYDNFESDSVILQHCVHVGSPVVLRQCSLSLYIQCCTLNYYKTRSILVTSPLILCGCKASFVTIIIQVMQLFMFIQSTFRIKDIVDSDNSNLYSYQFSPCDPLTQCTTERDGNGDAAVSMCCIKSPGYQLHVYSILWPVH